MGLRWLLLLVALVGLAPSPPPGAEDGVARLLRGGQAAFDKGDYAAALELFERAEPVAGDPGQVTFALAATRFRLALAGGEEAGRHLAEAAELFRCTLDPDNPRRPSGLLGLGSCLLVRATRARDHVACDEALRVLGECAAGPDSAESREARRLLLRARLLEWQLLPQPLDSQKQPEPNVPEEKKQPDQGTEPGPREKDAGTKNVGTRPTPVEDPGNKAQQTRDGPQSTRPAEGNESKPSDRDELPPLSPEDALRELREATRRIQAEQKAFRRTLARPAAEGVPDW